MAAISTISDNFDDNSINATLWSVGWWEGATGSITVAETGGQLSLTTQNLVAGSNYQGYLTNSTYDTTSDGAYVRLVQAQSAGGATETQWGLSSSVTDYMNFIVANGQIGTRNSTPSTANAVTYVPSTHAWLRIRESGGTVFWETAPSTASNPPSGGDWVAFASTAALGSWTKTAVKVQLGAGTYAANATQTIIFDGFNTATTSTAGSSKTLLTLGVG